MDKEENFALVAKESNPFELIEGKGVDQIIEIYFQINHLKQLYRRGWLRKERVSKLHCESVADHCFGMFITAWLVIDKFQLRLDMLKVFKMIASHEFGEVYGGDITPVDKISPEEKHRIEQASVCKIFKNFPRGEEYVAVWEEYEAKASKEARFVAQIDKLEMAFQAAIYQRQHDQDLRAFIASAEGAIHDSELCHLIRQIHSI